MSVLLDEILEQPAALKRLLDREAVNSQKVAAVIRKRDPRFVVIAARGTSDNAARYGQYLFGAHNHLTVALATPSLYTLYQSPPRLKDSLVLAISQSGQSPDICAVVEEGRRQGALTVAVTNDTASPLANLAEHCIDLQAGPELAIAASKTYTSSLLALAMLSARISTDREQLRMLERVPSAVSRLLRQAGEIVVSAAQYADAKACVTIGRGYNYATAFEIALKLKELTYILAEPYSSADFQHGPVALVQDRFLVLAVVPEGKPAAELTRFLDGLRLRGARLVIIASRLKTLALARTSIRLPAGLPEWLSPVAAVVPGQLFALGLAKARGLDPDHPRGLTKVTRTR
jgi:glucosamine--fructose-6-phosphate aminotransferase (isomerizing)